MKPEYKLIEDILIENLDPDDYDNMERPDYDGMLYALRQIKELINDNKG
jgi:hypothetical protein